MNTEAPWRVMQLPNKDVEWGKSVAIWEVPKPTDFQISLGSSHGFLNPREKLKEPEL